MDLLISDRAQDEISYRVLDLLRALHINNWQSEPHKQWQNFAERCYRDVKTYIKWVFNVSGAEADEWLLIFQYVC